MMVIVANYADLRESYGLLGPQLAATIIQEHTDYECIVLAVGHDFDKANLKSHISTLAGNDRPVIGFSNIGGRPDFWDIAHDLKAEGAITILGGPQADVDFRGEVNRQKHRNRFSGVKDSFSFALHGPAEQLIPVLTSRSENELCKASGVHCFRDGTYRSNTSEKWSDEFLKKVNWQNLFRLDPEGIASVIINDAQVVQQLGCPYAAKRATVVIDYPTTLHDTPFLKEGKISLTVSGCSFCDVARDKGFAGTLSLETVAAQIRNLPENQERRKIPFELVNEFPFPLLPQLLRTAAERGISISQINLVTRADWLIREKERFRGALNLARAMGVRILLSSVGFESFSNVVLGNLNKGYSADTNLSAVTIMRQLKEEFRENLFYKTAEGAVHGFIHPTPRDSAYTDREIKRTVSIYSLDRDILPPKSTPLIIHHACGLGTWIRELERRERIELKRRGSIIEWW
jgi:hypothetical protein